MTQIDKSTNNPNTNIPAIDPVTASSKSFTQSLSEVLTKLSGTNVTPNQLTNAKFNESILYAAHVYDQIKNTKGSQTLAKTFMNEIKMRYDRRIERNDTNALGKAINDILDNGVKNKQISSSQYNRIMSNALGYAQLDSQKNQVNNKLKNGGLEKINTLTSDNKKATNDERKAYEKTVSTTKFQAKSVTELQKNTMQKLFDSLKPVKKETEPKTQTKAAATTAKKPAANDESGKTVTKNDPTLETPSNHFDFRVKSKTDGKLFIRIPVQYSEDVTSIELVDINKNVLERSDDTKAGTDGRRQFTFASAGDKYPGISYVRINHTTGPATYIDVINNGKENFTQGFRRN